MSEAARVAAARNAVMDRIQQPVTTGLVLGTGLDALADAVDDAVRVPFCETPGFPSTSAPGHAGQLVVGQLFGRRVALMRGRVHLYEGWSASDVAMPVRLLAAIGARELVVTNAAGALNPRFETGSVMIIEDHLNFTGANPLAGPAEPDLGTGLRFPDMSRAYDPDLRSELRRAAAVAQIPVESGVYAGIAGPSLETSAERRWLRNSGADAVGMSTVLEVIAAVHMGLRVLGLSAITNPAHGGPEQQPDTIEDVLANANRAGARIRALLQALWTSP